MGFTVCIIKPDAVERGFRQAIKDEISETLGFIVKLGFSTKLELYEAEQLYSEHKEKDYFKDLTEFASSGPCYIMIIEGEGVVRKLRYLLGAYEDPEPGTLRARYATDYRRNAVHASSDEESAFEEVVWVSMVLWRDNISKITS